IPFSITRGLSLNSSPIAVVLRALLRIPQGFHCEDLYQFFTSTLISNWKPIDAAAFKAFIDKYDLGQHASFMNAAEIMERFLDYKSEQEARHITQMHFDVLSLDRFARSANISGGPKLFEDWFLPLDRFYFKKEYFRVLDEPKDLERLKRRYLQMLRQ